MCFTCDPYPIGYDTTATREIIKLLKEHGNHVQILTKGTGMRDLDLLDKEDWYGITLDGTREGTSAYAARVDTLAEAYVRGIKTWVSFEPVTNEINFYKELHLVEPIAHRVKIGKLNYHKSQINWKKFGKNAETICRELGLDYYIKDSLREEMERG